jgi:parallel beta-helix repeat protein
MRANIALGLGLGLSLALLWLLNTPATDRSTARAAAYTVCLGGPPTCDYDTLQAAVDASDDGDVIKVASGTYTGTQGRPVPDGYPAPPGSGVITQVLYISKSITIRGGYSSAFNEPPDPEVYPTTLDAEGQGRVLFITGDTSPTLEGLRLTGGDAEELGGRLYWNPRDGETKRDVGGGVYVISAAATVSNCRLFDNSAKWGGGLYLDHSAITLNANSVFSNTFLLPGAGLYLYGSDAMLNGNAIFSNSGSGLHLYSSTAMLNGNTVFSNSHSGLYLFDSAATLNGNAIFSNGGDGLGLSYGSDATLNNNNISSNDGSGIYVTGSGWPSSTVALTNTILVSHSVGITVAAGNTVTLQATLWGTGSAGFSDWGGEGTISSTLDVWGDPALRCAGSACIGPYHIGPGSAALDVGVETGVMTDVDSEPRPYRLPDLGADEYWPPGALKLVYLPLVLRQQ